MTDATDKNLDLWNAHADIDPKFTKAITGRDYQGTSPNPQYVIKCLTSLFGPVGQGFGWRVLADGFERLGDTTLHWCRIEFWHTDRVNTFESYGQTKAAYTTSAGKSRVDEDAPKKSLTDAIVKAASQVGIAANIFLGRWDDQKYVAAVNAEYRDAEKKDVPEFDPAAARDRLLAGIAKRKTSQDLRDYWKAERDALADLKTAKPPMYAEVETAFKKAAVQDDPARQAPPVNDLGGDAIPYRKERQ